MLKRCLKKRQNKRDNCHLLTLLSAEKVLSVTWDPARGKAGAHLLLTREAGKPALVLCPWPFSYLCCLLCHSSATSWGAEFLSETNQSCCFWLLLGNQGMLQPPAMISGLLMGEGYLHSNEAVTCKRGNTEVFRRNIWELFRRKGTGRELVDMSMAYH